MAKRHGYEWRIQMRTDDGSHIQLASPDSEAKSLESCSAHGLKHKPQPLSPPNTCFDELVIDDWLHLEQMNETCWWLSVGDKRIWIHFDENGMADVSFEDESDAAV